MDNEALKKINCKQAARLMSMWRDRVLSTDENESLKHQLYVCINCKRFDTQLDFLSRLSKKYAQGVGMPSTATISSTDADTDSTSTSDEA